MTICTGIVHSVPSSYFFFMNVHLLVTLQAGYLGASRCIILHADNTNWNPLTAQLWMLLQPTAEHKWPSLEYGMGLATLAFHCKAALWSDGRMVVDESVNCMCSGRTLFHLLPIYYNFCTFCFWFHQLEVCRSLEEWHFWLYFIVSHILLLTWQLLVPLGHFWVQVIF